MPFVLLVVVALVMYVVLHRSVFGRYLYAVGRNEEAARYSGIRTQAVIVSAYVVEGLLVAISGVLFAFYSNSISPAIHGNSYELYGIAAAVLGGCSLRGGEGSILGIVIGTMLLQVLRNLITLLGIPSSLEFAVMGAVIFLGVLVDQLLGQRKQRGQDGGGVGTSGSWQRSGNLNAETRRHVPGPRRRVTGEWKESRSGLAVNCPIAVRSGYA